MPNIVAMYFIYSVAHLSSLFAGGIPVNVAGHDIISTDGSSFLIKYMARFMWSSVVITTMRFRLRCVAIARITNAFWYVDLDSDSIIAGRDSGMWPFAPAPIIYKSAVGNSCILRMANGMRRSSPVRTKMLSFGKIVPQRTGATDLKIIPPIIKQQNITKDGVNNRRIVLWIL